MAAQCTCTNISIMQLFHELKQKFPAIPDRVVSDCIRKNYHDKNACMRILENENHEHLRATYPAALKTNLSGESFHLPQGGLSVCESCSRSCKNSNSSLTEDKSFNMLSRVQEDFTGFKSDNALGCSSNSSLLPHTNIDNQISSTSSRDENLMKPSKSKDFQPINILSDNAYCQLNAQEAKEHFKNSHMQNCIFENCVDPNTSSIIEKHSDINCGHFNESLQILEFNNIHKLNSSQPSNQNCPSPSKSINCKHSNIEQNNFLLNTTFHNSSHMQSQTQSSNIPKENSANCIPLFENENPISDKLSSTDDYEVNVNYRVQCGRSGSSVNLTTNSPGGQRRVKSILQVQPSPPFPWGAASKNNQEQPRSFTSVNLTLRTPTLESQTPIDIQSSTSNAGHFIYSTAAYHPQEGFQSKLQICIGPGSSGSVTASRTRLTRPHSYLDPATSESWIPPRCQGPTRAESLPNVPTNIPSNEDYQPKINIDPNLNPATQKLILDQLNQKEKLEKELKREKEKLKKIHRGIDEMLRDLDHRDPRKNTPAITYQQKVEKLRHEIKLLQEECERMTNEVDIYSGARFPLGETNEEFYKNIYTGQRGLIHSFESSNPRRSVPPNTTREDATPTSRPSLGWTCSECTFRNHPLLNKCEECDMPRLSAPTLNPFILPCSLSSVGEASNKLQESTPINRTENT